MKTFLRSIPAILASMLIAAHFLRDGMIILVVVSVAMPALLLIPSRFGPVALQCLLFLAAAEWVRTLVLLAQERAAMGAPWLRMALILAAVTAFTFVAALLVRPVRQHDVDRAEPSNA